MNDKNIEDTVEYCEGCGEEMAYIDIGKRYITCENDFCPKLFDSVSKEMAIRIVKLKTNNLLLDGIIENRERLIKFLKGEK